MLGNHKLIGLLGPDSEIFVLLVWPTVGLCGGLFASNEVALEAFVEIYNESSHRTSSMQNRFKAGLGEGIFGQCIFVFLHRHNEAFTTCLLVQSLSCSIGLLGVLLGALEANCVSDSRQLHKAGMVGVLCILCWEGRSIRVSTGTRHNPALL